MRARNTKINYHVWCKRRRFKHLLIVICGASTPPWTNVTKYPKAGGGGVCRLPEIKYTFNDHFSSVGTKIKQRIPYQTGNFKGFLNRGDAKGKLFIYSSNHFLFPSPTVPMEVEKIIDVLDMKKATGPMVYQISSWRVLNFSFLSGYLDW